MNELHDVIAAWQEAFDLYEAHRTRLESLKRRRLPLNDFLILDQQAKMEEAEMKQEKLLRDVRMMRERNLG